jgi:hypothetical protein
LSQLFVAISELQTFGEPPVDDSAEIEASDTAAAAPQRGIALANQLAVETSTKKVSLNGFKTVSA